MFKCLIILMVFASPYVSGQNRDSVFREASDQAMHHAIAKHKGEIARLTDASATKLITDNLHRNAAMKVCRCKSAKRKPGWKNRINEFKYQK